MLEAGGERRRSKLQRRPPPPAGVDAEPAGFSGVRLSVAQADTTLRRVADQLAPPRSLLSREPFNILALSGGAAGGAFGAGVLFGLSQSGRRPEFAIVTGVSTGALLSPFAFLGPRYDETLARAYTGGEAGRLLSLRRLATGFARPAWRPSALESLVSPYVTRALLDEVAVEHARGRRLLVASTNLDAQKASIWDMGAIASHPGQEAVRLFREVLVASASLPGLFGPKLLDVLGSDGVKYQELHVDGGASAPLFVMPDALLRWRELGSRVRGGCVYVIVNTVLDAETRNTPVGLGSVLFRSADTMLRCSYHQALSVTAGFCGRHGLPLKVVSMPAEFSGLNLLRFENGPMQRIFDRAVELTRSDQTWSTLSAGGAEWLNLLRWPSFLTGDAQQPPRARRRWTGLNAPTG
jgi:hypothetical protein